MKRAILLSFLLLMLCIQGCAHVISEEYRKVSAQADFESLRDNPQAFAGKIVVLGGVVSDLRNTGDGGEIEIIQYRLSEDGFPLVEKGSQGRFLATSPTLIDAEIAKDSLITVAGELKGSRTLPLPGDGKSLRYPVISIREKHLWQVDENRIKPFQIPGTDLVDPYYMGKDVQTPIRPQGTIIRSR